MRLVCYSDGPHHPYTLMTLIDHRGTIEIECPRCGQIRRFGSGLEPVIEVRCTNTWKNSGTGWCGRLNYRMSPDTVGTAKFTCQACRVRRTLRIDTPAMALST